MAEFVYNYGHWSEDLARELWRRRSRSAADAGIFRYPMIKRVAERSRAVIVHNPRAAAAGRMSMFRRDGDEIPHLFALPADLPAASEVSAGARQSRHRTAHAFLFGVFGYICASRNVCAGAAASFPACARARPRWSLLVAGDFVSSGSRPRGGAAVRDDAGSRDCPILPSAISGVRARRWTPASTCAIRWRAKPPGSRSG